MTFDLIRQYEEAVGAFAYIDVEKALEESRRLNREQLLSPLHGVPVAVKDVIDTSDMPTEYNSPIYSGHRPSVDAECVIRLRRAGALILGKSVTAEFAHDSPGRTRNPINLDFSPGGSSSGSAAAVCAGFVPLALGTQTGGSTIKPASYCGIFGYKPTFGQVPMVGVKPLAPTLDTIGYFSRSLEDLSTLHLALTSTPVESRSKGRVRIAVVRPEYMACAEESSVTALQKAQDLLLEAGLVVEPLQLPPLFDSLPQAASVIMEYEASKSLEMEYNEYPSLMSEMLRAALARGQETSPESLHEAYHLQHICSGLLESVLGEYDAILTLSASGEAPAGRGSGDSLFNRAWTLLHVPCLNLPFATGPHGLPIGIQLVGRKDNDASFLALARHLWGYLGRSATEYRLRI